MVERRYQLHNGKKGAALTVRIVPRSSKNEVADILHDGTVKIRLTTAADDPNLNRDLKEYLSIILGVPPDRIDIVAGTTGLDKLISILDLDPMALQQRILQKLS